MVKKFFLSLFCLPIFLSATPYYVSNAGNDNNDGISPATAWQTVAKVNGMTAKIHPGDSILFERDGLWRESLRINISGQPKSPVVIGSYGSGPLPTFSGADIVTGWNLVPENGFNAYSAPLAKAPANVFEDGNFLGYEPVASTAALTVGSYYYDPTNAVLYVRTVEDSSPAAHLIEASVRSVGVGMYASYITYRQLHTTMAAYFGMNMSSAYSFVTIDHCWADKSKESGIHIADTEAFEHNIAVTNNLADWNMQDGIKISVQGSHFYIKGNEVHHNAFFNGINIYTGGIYIVIASPTATRQTNVITTNNLAHENGPLTNPKNCYTCGNGIWHDTVGTGSVIENNISWGNTFAGVFVEDTGVDGGQSILNNTTYSNGLFGVYLSRRSWGVTVAGNTSYQNLHNIEIIGQCGDEPVGMVNNVIQNNTTWGGSANELVATCGAANEGQNGSGNVYTNNNLGTGYNGFVYWATSSFSSYNAWLASAGPAASGSY